MFAVSIRDSPKFVLLVVVILRHNEDRGAAKFFNNYSWRDWRQLIHRHSGNDRFPGWPEFVWRGRRRKFTRYQPGARFVDEWHQYVFCFTSPAPAAVCQWCMYDYEMTMQPRDPTRLSISALMVSVNGRACFTAIVHRRRWQLPYLLIADRHVILYNALFPMSTIIRSNLSPSLTLWRHAL